MYQIMLTLLSCNFYPLCTISERENLDRNTVRKCKIQDAQINISKAFSFVYIVNIF